MSFVFIITTKLWLLWRYSFNYDWFVLGIQAAVCQFKGFQWSFAGRKSRGKTKHHTVKQKDHLCGSLADPDINIWLSVKELSIIFENPLVDLFLKVDAVITVPFCWKILRNQSHRKKWELYKLLSLLQRIIN